jgi:hypothetical protein
MLFRPEEMDAASGGRPVLRPLSERDVDITTNSRLTPTLYHPVAHQNLHRFTTIETWSIYLYCFVREHPADRQGFEASLGEPFLVPIDGDAVLVGEVVEWGEGRNQVCIRVKPYWHLAVVHEVMEQFLPLLW